MVKKFPSYLGKVFLLSIFGLVILIWPRPVPQLTAYFFDVGQGDSELLVMPGNQTVLVDGGPSFGLVAKLDQVLPLTHRQIDLMVLTHPHDDHLIGLLEVLRVYPVKEVLITGVPANTLAWQAFSRLLAAKQIKVTTARRGLQWQFVEFQPAKSDQSILPASNRGPPTLTVIYPLIDISKQDFKDLNDS
ncbi:MAG: MBL fold metallo-hydrolase, partial [Candidatus Komeilibacteria bacterium]|nr:MBL fold metallo-hydrolase [Candidatus Komeilibacteria bacterium]